MKKGGAEGEVKDVKEGRKEGRKKKKEAWKEGNEGKR